MQNEIILNMQAGIRDFLFMINWLFIAFFILLTWLFNDFVDAKNKAAFLNFLKKLPRILRVLILATICIVFFAWAFNYNTRLDFVRLIFSTFFAMTLWKIGFNRVFAWISKKVIGINFLDDGKQT